MTSANNTNNNIYNNTISNKNTIINGLVSGSIGAFAVYPIDVIKTRMQNQNSQIEKLYNSGFDCAKKLWKQGRHKLFYKGCLPQLVGIGPEKAIKLYVYNYYINNNQNSNIYNHVIGGLLAGTSQVIITCPYEVIKINLQMNQSFSINLSGLTGLYKGACACFLRDIHFSGIYFPLYWFLKEKENYNPFLAGTIAAAPAALLCTPADVIKTRIQTINKSNTSNTSNKIINTTISIYKNEGFSAFWKGGGWRVLRSSPQLGITMIVYDFLSNKM
jgi:solute carrier family 25 aspartate/glutamate transporter 12/13